MVPANTHWIKRPPQNVLMLTDGSDRANRKAEWELVFSDLPRTTIHRIEVLDCLDSGVIIRKRRGTPENDCERWSRSRISVVPYRMVVHNREYAPEVDVLHGVPHEALLDYVEANAIDQIVMSIGETTDLNRSFIGRTFATVGRVATVPVKTIGSTSDSHESRFEADLIAAVQRT